MRDLAIIQVKRIPIRLKNMIKMNKIIHRDKIIIAPKFLNNLKNLKGGSKHI